MFRRRGYQQPVTIISADEDGPYDRPNISKDYLAGTAPEEWIPLRPPDWYQKTRVDLLTSRRVVRLLPDKRSVELDDGRHLEYGALLLATGASPIRLDVPGAQLPHVHYLRTLSDSRTIIERATQARRAVIVGASFIGLEVAASLRTRNLDVHVVAPEEIPMQRVLGGELGRFVREAARATWRAVPPGTDRRVDRRAIHHTEERDEARCRPGGRRDRCPPESGTG